MQADRAQPQVIDATAPATDARLRRRLLPALIAAPFALLAVVYLADLVYSKDRVARGTTAAGVAIGGMTLRDAEQLLRATVSPRITRPIPVTAADQRATIDPEPAGLSVDWAATVEQAGAQPLNPLTRLTPLFTTREIGVVSTADDAALTAALDDLDARIERDPAEGTVRFDGDEPVAVYPENGRHLDVDAAAALLKRDWAAGATIDLIVAESGIGHATASRLLTAMEQAALRTEKVDGPYGSRQLKRLYIYGGLDTAPTEFGRSFGFRWNMAGWLLTYFLEEVGPAEVARMRQRVGAELKGIFASKYTSRIPLAGVLDPANIAAYGKRATGEKYLVLPQA